jgi:CheY-like chemotaxis protein
MVHGFIKQSGGHIKIHSEEGHGTTVRLYLPRVDGEPVPQAESAAAARVGGGEQILIVDDNDGVRSIVLRQLRELGYRTVEAGNAEQALAALSQRPDIDLLFTDVVMPGGIAGQELANIVLSRHPGVKVLFTSGFAQLNGSRAGAPLSVPHLLTKPYRKQDLARAVRAALDAKRYTQEPFSYS